VSGCEGIPYDTVGVLLVRRHVHLPDRRALVEQAVRELAEPEALPGLRQLVSLAQAPAENPARLGVREMDDEILVDRQHPFLEPLEQEPQAVAFSLEAAEGAAQLAAHPVEAVGEQPELVGEARAERCLEVAASDRLGRRVQASEAQGDELGEQEPDDDADHARDDSGPERFAVDRVDGLGCLGLPADRHEHLAVVRDRCHEPPSVGRA